MLKFKGQMGKFRPPFPPLQLPLSLSAIPPCYPNHPIPHSLLFPPAIPITLFLILFHSPLLPPITLFLIPSIPSTLILCFCGHFIKFFYYFAAIQMASPISPQGCRVCKFDCTQISLESFWEKKREMPGQNGPNEALEFFKSTIPCVRERCTKVCGRQPAYIEKLESE